MLIPPTLQSLPKTLPLEGAVRLELVEGVPIFRASSQVQHRIESLLDKQKTATLTADEVAELDSYEEMDDYLSFVNRAILNLEKRGTTEAQRTQRENSKFLSWETNLFQTAPLQTKVPVSLINQAQKLVDAGWFRDVDEIVLDALRRFLESHREELMEDFIRQDVEWGLTGE